MNGQVINAVVTRPPRPGHAVTMAALGGTASMPLTELYEQAGRLAVALAGEGIGRGDRIGILASNRIEWLLLDLAALRLGAVTAGFEPVKFAPGPELAKRYSLDMLFADRGEGEGIRPITDVAGLIAGVEPGAEPPAILYRPGDVTTIKFTSGSTGTPKGLAPTVGSIDSSISAVQRLFEHGAGHHRHPDNIFIFLPLSLLQQRYWVYSALVFGHDLTITTYEAAFAVMGRAEPTVVMGVPGFFEAAKKHIESRGPGKQKAAAIRLFGGKIRYLWTGSAPARQSVLSFFSNLGFPIFEGYGLNETDIVSKNHPGAHREGSVGQVLPGKKVLIDADGVVSVQSDHPVNWRYEYAAPGESERVFGPGGVVRTGDLGYLDEDGFLYIRGRADDVIVLDNGKKVIVRPLEEFLKASPAIEDCVVLCPTQTHLVAVVSAASDQADTGAIRARLAEANASFGPDEQIRDLVIAPERFSVANGMLTSQFKPRRPEILRACLGGAAR
ncbi:MAG TPA: AMP-binding protein [Streptosporangiaceae bacterium]|nr:AMP-binding protein [Streptosporangiaceae bacterium]